LAGNAGTRRVTGFTRASVRCRTGQKEAHVFIDVLGPVVAIGFIVAVLGGALVLAGRRDRTRALVIARQVMLTDAIHRELGAVVSPVVEKQTFGRWQVHVSVPVERPAIVGRIVAIAESVLGTERVAAGGLRIVLTPRAETTRPRLVSRVA
jgi:hypothetical protein